MSRALLRLIGSFSISFRLRTLYCFALLSLVLFYPLVQGVAQDENATRDVPSATGRKTRKPPTAGRKPKVEPRYQGAIVTISVDPADSTVYLDAQQLDIADPSTGLRLAGLKPGPHTLTVRNPPHYAEREQVINLKLGENEPLTIKLERLIGTLDVFPSIPNSLIKIENVEGEQRTLLATHSDRVSNLQLAPGLYDLTISNSGYQTATRRITIKPGESLFLEPQLSALPSIPASAPTRTVAAIPSRSIIETAGKYFIVQLHGASGDAEKRVGTINVTLGASRGNNVTGSLPGHPCQVQFVKLENVAESSLVEAPGPSNRWGKIVVRVRPKDSKRPIVFAINWTLLEASLAGSSTLAQGSLVEAIAVQKVPPNYPAMARTSHTTGTVDVFIVIDAQGSVVSAKATDGPSILRVAAEDAARKWKFRPATRNGQPIESTQTIRFVFEKK